MVRDSEKYCAKCSQDVFLIGHTPQCPVPLEQDIMRLEGVIEDQRQRMEVARASVAIIVNSIWPFVGHSGRADMDRALDLAAQSARLALAKLKHR